MAQGKRESVCNIGDSIYFKHVQENSLGYTSVQPSEAYPDRDWEGGGSTSFEDL